MTPSPLPAEPPPPARNRAERWLPCAFLAVGLVITAVVALQTWRFNTQEHESRTEAEVSRMRTDLMLHAYRHIDVLRTYQAEFAAHSGTSPEALETMAKVLELDERLPGIELVGDVLISTDARTDQQLYSVRYVYPQELTGRPPVWQKAGDATHSEAVRVEAVRRARDTGGFAATAPIRSALHPEDGVIMVYLPLYRDGIPPDSLDARQRSFMGATFLAMQPEKLMEPLFDEGITPTAHVKLHFEQYADAVPVEAPRALLYDNHPERATSTEDNRMVQQLNVGGTIWSLDVDLGPATATQRWLPWVVVAVGALLSVLSACVLYILQRSRRLSQQLSQRDRTLRREMEAALHLRHRAIEASASAMLIASATEHEYPVEYVNPAFERMTGYRAEEVIGQSLRIMHGSDTHQEGLDKLRQLLREQQEGETTLRNYRKDGQLYWTRVHLAPVRDENGEVTHFVASKYDITQTRRDQEALEFQAWHDALTHLPNRHLLRKRLQETIHETRQSNRPFWVAFLDLDNFKLINDTLGHTLGDRVLQQIARRLQDALHADDIVARRGGDEFVFILFDDDPPRNARATLHRIMTAVSRPLKVESQRFFPAASIGVAIHPQDGDDPELLIQRADMAMYHAKQQGRNNYQFYSDALQEQAARRVALEGDLRAALANDEFELHYQPQVRLSDGKTLSLEALVRWRHPERGLIPPGQFIPLAEETGLIVPLGEWILRTACRQAKKWSDDGLPPLRIAVNLSARQFNDQHLPTLIHCLLREFMLPPELLELELTETLVMKDVRAASHILHKLKSLGVVLSLDDFGTGYSSLAQLKRFPLDIIKIDQSFVSNLTHDRNDATIVHTIIKLAHNLGMVAVAEGVETPEQEAVLREHGCDFIQGYHVSRPLPAAELEQWLLKHLASEGHTS